jgi:hypothetical protein
MSDELTAGESLGIVGVGLYQLHVSSGSAMNLVFATVQTDWKWVAVKDLDLRYLLVNHEYERCHQVQREQIRGKTDFDIHPQGVAETVLRLPIIRPESTTAGNRTSPQRKVQGTDTKVFCRPQTE